MLDSIGKDDCVFVADNGSDDGSVEMLKDKFPQVKIIPFKENLGFTGGYNAALREIEAQYYVLLNSDVQVAEGWLETLSSWMDSHPDCAVCGPKILKLEKAETGYVQTSTFEYAGAAGGYVDLFGYPFCRGRVLSRIERDFGQYDTPHNVLWVSGACLMVRSSVWKETGGFDGRFFAHMEEIDFCWKAGRAGWNVTLVPQASVYHLGGGTLDSGSPLKLKLNYRNNLLLLKNNLPESIKAHLTIALRYLLDLGSALTYLLTGRFSAFLAVMRAHSEYGKLSRGARLNGTEVPGHMRLCIIPKALFKGERIFEYLREYENNH